MTELDSRLGGLLQHRKIKRRFRSVKEYDTSDRSGLIDFSSNDYLSLSSSKALRQNYLDRLGKADCVFGSTGSRLLSGGTAAHHALETRLRDHFRAPAALLFNSGWDANVSFFSTVPQASDWIIYDELVHASVHDGMRGSRVPKDRRIAFSHNNPIALEAVLRQTADAPGGSRAGTVFLAMESLYSMDGDLANLKELLDVLDKRVPRSRQCVVLDEAHTTGLYGAGGRGYTCALREEERVTVRLMTFGKAVGCSGAVLLCSPTVRSFLINFARPLIFSTALPHSTLLALESAWDVLDCEEGDQRRTAINALAQKFDERIRPVLAKATPALLSLPPCSPDSSLSSARPEHPADNERLQRGPISPIIGLLTPNPHALSAYLLEQGYVVRPVVPPTVPAGGERVRICLRADMGRDVIEGLVRALASWVDESLREALSSSRSPSRSARPSHISVRAKL